VLASVNNHHRRHIEDAQGERERTREQERLSPRGGVGAEGGGDGHRATASRSTTMAAMAVENFGSVSV